jgi:hypothetical protein
MALLLIESQSPKAVQRWRASGLCSPQEIRHLAKPRDLSHKFGERNGFGFSVEREARRARIDDMAGEGIEIGARLSESLADRIPTC